MLPEGRAIAVYNTTWRDKREWVEGQDARPRTDTTVLAQLLKLRYGLTDRVELGAVVPYTTYAPRRGDNLDSLGDVALTVSYGFLLERMGDPVSLSAKAIVNAPTGQVGESHLPGIGAWGTGLVWGLTKKFGLNKVDFDLGGTVPLTEGNRRVTKSETGFFNYKYAYALTDRIDLGVEGTVERAWNGERNDVTVNNHYLEWYTGPAVTFAIPEWQSWVGLGVYFPVYRDYGQDTATESCRVDFKFGIFW